MRKCANYRRLRVHIIFFDIAVCASSKRVSKFECASDALIDDADNKSNERRRRIRIRTEFEKFLYGSI